MAIVHYLERIREGLTTPVEIDAPLPAGDSTFADVMPDPAVAAQLKGLDQEELRAAVGEALNGLPLSDRVLMSLRFGLDGGRAIAVQELAEGLGVAPEAVHARVLRSKKLLRPALAGFVRPSSRPRVADGGAQRGR